MNLRGQRRRTRAFTLVEIMIVAALIGLLAAMAIPAMARARANSQRSACINNLRQIDQAKNQWALEFKMGQGAKPSDSDLFGLGAFLARKPDCPAGGTYIIGKVKETPMCTQPTHELE